MYIYIYMKFSALNVTIDSYESKTFFFTKCQIIHGMTLRDEKNAITLTGDKKRNTSYKYFSSV